MALPESARKEVEEIAAKTAAETFKRLREEEQASQPKPKTEEEEIAAWCGESAEAAGEAGQQ